MLLNQIPLKELNPFFGGMLDMQGVLRGRLNFWIRSAADAGWPLAALELVTLTGYLLAVACSCIGRLSVVPLLYY